MNKNFNIKIACDYGINEAVFVSELIKLCDGELSSWNVLRRKDICTMFPYFTEKTARTVISKCINKGILLKSYLNENKMDRSLSYRFTDSFIDYINKIGEE